MKLLRRLIAWFCFAGSLTAFGMVVFVYFRHTPRSRVAGPLGILHFSADGACVVTVTFDKEGAVRGPLQVWNTQSGRVVREMFAGKGISVSYWPWETQLLGSNLSCPDDRHLAFFADGRLWLVDWREGRKWSVERPSGDHAVFCGNGRWVFGMPSAIAGFWRMDNLLSTATHRVAKLPDGSSTMSTGGHFCFAWADQDRSLQIWNLEEGRKLGRIPLINSSYFESCPNDRFLVIWREAESSLEGVKKSRSADSQEQQMAYRGVDVWDLTTFQHRFRHDMPNAGALHATFSADSQSLALRFRSKVGSYVEMLDLPSGKLLWTFPLGEISWDWFSPDGALWCCWHGSDESKRAYTVFDVQSGRVLLETSPGFNVNLTGMPGVVILQESQTKPIEIVNVRTGERRSATSMGQSSDFCRATPDGKHLLITGRVARDRNPYFFEEWLDKWWPELFGYGLDRVAVMETSSRRSIFQVASRELKSFGLAEDGSTLVTVNPMPDAEYGIVIRTWDVHPHRAWFWAITWSVSIGVVLLLLRRWRWKRKATA